MQGIERATARVSQIRARVASPPVPGRFQRVLEERLAADAESAAPPDTRPERTPSTPVATRALSSAPVTAPVSRYATPSVTLGAMTGTGRPVAAPRAAGPAPDGIASRSELDAYLEARRIEDRNGRLGDSNLVTVSGAWRGTARLLPPAAAAY